MLKLQSKFADIEFSIVWCVNKIDNLLYLQYLDYHIIEPRFLCYQALRVDFICLSSIIAQAKAVALFFLRFLWRTCTMINLRRMEVKTCNFLFYCHRPVTYYTKSISRDQSLISIENFTAYSLGTRTIFLTSKQS